MKFSSDNLLCTPNIKRICSVIKATLISLTILLLSACGGGGSSDEDLGSADNSIIIDQSSNQTGNNNYQWPAHIYGTGIDFTVKENTGEAVSINSVIRYFYDENGSVVGLNPETKREFTPESYTYTAEGSVASIKLDYSNGLENYTLSPETETTGTYEATASLNSVEVGTHKGTYRIISYLLKPGLKVGESTVKGITLDLPIEGETTWYSGSHKLVKNNSTNTVNVLDKNNQVIFNFAHDDAVKSPIKSTQFYGDEVLVSTSQGQWLYNKIGEEREVLTYTHSPSTSTVHAGESDIPYLLHYSNVGGYRFSLMNSNEGHICEIDWYELSANEDLQLNTPRFVTISSNTVVLSQEVHNGEQIVQTLFGYDLDCNKLWSTEMNDYLINHHITENGTLYAIGSGITPQYEYFYTAYSIDINTGAMKVLSSNNNIQDLNVPRNHFVVDDKGYMYVPLFGKLLIINDQGINTIELFNVSHRDSTTVNRIRIYDDELIIPVYVQNEGHFNGESTDSGAATLRIDTKLFDDF